MKSILFMFLSALSCALGYKILCIMPAPSRSHNLLGTGIVNALLDAGHEVTWATPYPQLAKANKNLRTIDVSGTIDLIKILEASHMLDPTKMEIRVVQQFARNISSIAVNTPMLREVVAKEQFDAVVTEWFFSDTDAGYAAVQQVPWVVLLGTVMQPWMEYLTDDVRSLSTVPFAMTKFPVPMNFFQRIMNNFIFSSMYFSDWWSRSEKSAIFEKEFGDLARAKGRTLPPYLDAVQNISVLFVNSHPSITPAQALPPNVIDIAGYHIQDGGDLPKDLQDILDNSPNGVVYFSMGSVVKPAMFAQKAIDDLVKILGELPLPVLWKFDEIKDLPKNVHVRSWFPQPAILAHPNVKLFITHGGQLSSLEAIHYGVPLLAIPVFGDQPSNANRAERLGYAKAVPFDKDMGPQIQETLHEMLSNKKYGERAKFLSHLFNKRPVHPAKLVPHYVEIAIESKGAYHLRSTAYLYSWYQRWMLDQAALLFGSLYLVYRILKKLLCLVTGSGQQKADSKQKLKKK